MYLAPPTPEPEGGGGEIGSSSWTQLRLTWIRGRGRSTGECPGGLKLEARPNRRTVPKFAWGGWDGRSGQDRAGRVQTGLSSLVGFTGGCHHLLVIAWLLLSRILRKSGSTNVSEYYHVPSLPTAAVVTSVQDQHCPISDTSPDVTLLLVYYYYFFFHRARSN
ncbi:hypothetical protein BGZ61DRAFT_83368 [Ilyonectria robusta]|uniref:uncharacterized protein n=1 Tax=Ilyonectria robusta TaxID=1079257 RepID=UPI001E8ECA9A|nr:uncharacterized protein BGZ61DRAFT_83368 [Ilyonectria robusta]KAH8735676.1 hypothetical protein BGZ61DRAFT_83368 [Ilyonectria robusta]